MQNEQSRQWLNTVLDTAQSAGHIFPAYAAAEAALESSFGKSELVRIGNNLFGTKQHTHPIYGTLNIPTKEFLRGQWVVVSAAWVQYPDLASSFADRMATLRRMANGYPHYKNALEATDGHIYVREVSQSWSTDPNRANKVISIHDEYFTDVEQLRAA